MDKKYLVFVSSKFIGLENERNAVIEALLKSDGIPTAMEYFPASNEDKMTYIYKMIDECDCFILLLAGLYGTIEEKSQLSYTELEYNYAAEIGKPILAFLHTHPEDLISKHRESQQLIIEKLEMFKKKVGTLKLCGFWESTLELKSNVLASFSKLKEQNIMIGWVKANNSNTLQTESKTSYNLRIQDIYSDLLKEYSIEYYLEYKDPKTYKTIQSDMFKIRTSYVEIFKHVAEICYPDEKIDVSFTIIDIFKNNKIKENIYRIPEDIFANKNFKLVCEKDINSAILKFEAMELLSVTTRELDIKDYITDDYGNFRMPTSYKLRRIKNTYYSLTKNGIRLASYINERN